MLESTKCKYNCIEPTLFSVHFASWRLLLLQGKYTRVIGLAISESYQVQTHLYQKCKLKKKTLCHVHLVVNRKTNSQIGTLYIRFFSISKKKDVRLTQ